MNKRTLVASAFVAITPLILYGIWFACSNRWSGDGSGTIQFKEQQIGTIRWSYSLAFVPRCDFVENFPYVKLKARHAISYVITPAGNWSFPRGDDFTTDLTFTDGYTIGISSGEDLAYGKLRALNFSGSRIVSLLADDRIYTISPLLLAPKSP